MNRRHLLAPVALAISTVLLPGKAQAVALGEVFRQSAIGAPLSLDIRLLRGNSATALECLSILSGPAREGIPTISNARLERIPGELGAIRVSSPQIANEPVLRLVLENQCQSRLRREFVVLLPFPTEISAPVSQPAARPSPSARTERAPAAPAASPPPVRNPSPARASPAADRNGFDVWTLAPGETVAGIARLMFPRSTEARESFLRQILRSNPELLPDRAALDRPMPAGTELRVPKRVPISEPAQSLPPLPAREPQARPSAAPAPDEPSAPPPQAPAAPRSAAPEQDRLLIQGDNAAPPARPALLPGEFELLAALDDQLIRQLELNERIRQMEMLQATLHAQLAELDLLAARTGVEIPGMADRPIPDSAPTIPTTPPRTAPASAPTSWVDRLMEHALLLVGSVAVALGLLLFAVRRRQGKPSSKEDILPAIPPAPSSSSSAAIPAASAQASLDDPSTGLSEWVNKAQTSAAARANEDPFGDERNGQALPAVTVLEEDFAEEHESAIELADIMISFGRMQGAAETLAEFIRSNPKQSVTPWLKLLDVYRAADMRPEFEGLSRQLNKTFNVQVVTWDNYAELRSSQATLEQMPHLVHKLSQIWRSPESQAFLYELIRDNRDGTRQGFPLPVVDELLTLSGVLEQQMGVFRPPHDTEAGDLTKAETDSKAEAAPSSGSIATSP